MRFLLLLTLPLSGCLFEEEASFFALTGETMGTTYSVGVADAPDGVTEETLSASLEAVLAEVNSKMSNWDPASEVSRFNAAATTAPVEISPAFAHVMQAAADVHELSGGKFDVTLAPLIELWGFGPKKPGEPIPSDADITAALSKVGQSSLLELTTNTLAKADPEVSVNLSAIAKGYGVDRLAETLEEAGVERYVVEIGGDLRARGMSPDDNAWSVGVERPDAGTGSVELVVPLADRGLATSGDYRNYFEEDGVRYSHIIDPATGRPIEHSTASVTVVADTSMMADALATAFLVLGSEQGLPIAEDNDIAVFFIDRADNEFVTASSGAFDALIDDTQR